MGRWDDQDTAPNKLGELTEVWEDGMMYRIGSEIRDFADLGPESGMVLG